MPQTANVASGFAPSTDCTRQILLLGRAFLLLKVENEVRQQYLTVFETLQRLDSYEETNTHLSPTDAAGAIRSDGLAAGFVLLLYRWTGHRPI
jgi:hypothetical protein